MTGHPIVACTDDGTCPPGERCVDYQDVGGVHRRTCDVPCGPEKSCPVGFACTSTFDGPHDICRRVPNRASPQ